MEKNIKERPSYYAVIPAIVRYDNNIPAGAKLLYGEISSLCNKEGFCWARNAYFADLYQTSERTIINWINALKKYGYISVSFTYLPGKKEVENRFIKLIDAVFPLNKKEFNEKPDEEETSEQNNEVVKISSPRGEENFTTYGKYFPDVVKNFSKGGEKNFTDNIKNNNINNTSSSELSDSKTDPRSENDENPKEEEDLYTSSSENNFSPRIVYTQDEIKNTLLSVDKTLFLDNFYPQAAAFMSKHNLDKNYLTFIYNETGNTNYKSFKSMYYTLFFKNNKADEYKALSKPSETLPPPLDDIKCPVCGTVHEKNAEKCPNCSLPRDPTPEMISLFRELLTFPVDRRIEYLNRENVLYSEFKLDFKKLKTMINDLRHKFDLKTEYQFGLETKHEEPSRSYHSGF